MSWIRRTDTRRRYLPLIAAIPLAALTAGGVAVTAAAQPAAATQPAGHVQPGRTAGFVLDHGRYLPAAAPHGLENLVASPLAPIGINDTGQVTGSYSTQPGGNAASCWTGTGTSSCRSTCRAR